MKASKIYIYLFTSVATILLFGAVYKIVTSPDNTYDPFCTYTSQYSLDAKLKVGDEVLSSTINRQNSLSRDWAKTINYNGCQQAQGKALSFRSSDNRVFLVSTNICRLAEAALLELGEADFLKLCDEKNEPPDGFVITDANNPTQWQTFNPVKSDIATIILMHATKTTNPTSDALENVAPKILETRFDTDGSWWNSPERLLSFGRRQSNEIKYSSKKISSPDD